MLHAIHTIDAGGIYGPGAAKSNFTVYGSDVDSYEFLDGWEIDIETFEALFRANNLTYGAHTCKQAADLKLRSGGK